MPDEESTTELIPQQKLHVPKMMWVIGILVPLILLIFVWIHAEEGKQFALLLEHAEPMWILLILPFQLGTYAAAGLVWEQSIRRSGTRLPIRKLARLSIERLSVDQVVPTGGVAGSMVVIASIKHMGVKAHTAVETFFVDVLSYYAAHALATAVAVAVLFSHHSISTVVEYGVGVFGIFFAVVTSAVWWFVGHPQWKPPHFLLRLKSIASFFSMAHEVSPERVRSVSLLARATFFQLCVFVCDAATLWCAMRAIGGHVTLPVAFTAYVIGSVIGMISFLPGGVGGFEAGMVATLTICGAPLGAAVTATLLVRGFTLWLPLVPGLYFTQHSLRSRYYRS